MVQQLERRLVNEYSREKLFDKHHQARVWLGPTMPGKESAMYEVVGRWADLIVFEPHKITIIEAKLEPSSQAVGQLKLYAQLFKQTLRFQRYWKLPIYQTILTTRVDDHLQDLAKEEGIEYVVFRPEWIKYWEKRRFKL